MESGNEPIVIDNGGYKMRAGFSGEDSPRLVFPSIIGQVRNTTLSSSIKQGQHDQEEDLSNSNQRLGVDYFVGKVAKLKRGHLTLRNVIEGRKITNWDDMEKMWNYIFEEMKVDPTQRGILLSETPENYWRQDREKLTEIMFEKFRVPGLYLASQAALSLFASGRTTGLVLDFGDDITHSVPVYEGSALPHATLRMDIGGKELTNYMMKMVSKKGISLTTSADKDIAREIKENCCYVALNYDEECKKVEESKESVEKVFELPDGSQVNLDSERFQCTEIFFQPKLFDIESDNVIETISNTIAKCDLDIRADFRANIILSGGGSLFSGMNKRISKELISLFPEYKYKFKVEPPLGDKAVWLGGSLMASLSVLQNMWLTDMEYEEAGPGIVNRKFR